MDRTRRRLLSEQLPQEKAYWLNKLGGDLTLSGIPLDWKRTDVFNPERKTITIDLDAPSVSKLFKATDQNELLIFTILVTVLEICLAKYNGVEDVIVGTAVRGRHKENGLLNKILVLRDHVRGEATFRELLRDVKKTIHEAFSHQKFPFESILELLHVPAPENRTPLFNVVVLLDNIHENISDLKNDVTVVFSIKDGYLTSFMEYNSTLFEEKTLSSFAGHYNNVLRAVIAKPDQKISAIELLSPEEKLELIVGFNNTYRDYPSQQPIHQLFEAQVELNPDKIALVSGRESLNYRELNERANQLAHYLRELGVGPEVPVGIMMDRSLEMMVGLLGVLKAGGAYVPLDVQYPAERIAYLVEDTNAPVILTQERLVAHLGAHEARGICIDSQWAEISQRSPANPESSAGAENLAYVIYTSGSTGKPKGVGVSQRAVIRLVKETNYVELNADETFLHLAPLAFDASTFEIWGSLLNGARLVLMPIRQPSLAELGETLKHYGVTTLWLTAGLFHLMVDEGLADLTSLRQLLAGGDVLSVSHVQKFLHEAKDCTLINGYGPTENTTFTCCFGMRNGNDFQYSVPIGYPIAHTQVYVLDQQLQPVPNGATGELYIGGDGLARGYFHDAELTAERFIPHPFSQEGGQRLYRSGDLVRRVADGALEFIGRRDQQAKIRGFRIEPGEVESVLGQCAGVRDSAVIVRPDLNGEKRLVAYIVPDNGRRSSIKELKNYLKTKLPEYMLPAAFVMLDSLPLTVNGKVDRQALPEPENARPELEAGYVKARTETEVLLVSIWQNLLGTERVGVHDNFFDLGGHSLLATRLIMQVQQVFGVELPLWRVFEKPTVADMAEALEEAIRAGDKLPSMEAIARPERLPLSPAQHRLWFLDSLLPGTALYNVYTAFQLEGELNLAALERSLNEIVNRHEILRTTFPALHGQPSQKINETQSLDLTRHDLTDRSDADREGEISRLIKEETLRPFDLELGPLLRATLLKQGEQDHVLLLTMHHIISDGWSLEVLTRELSALYEAYSSGQSSLLEELPLQYADYAVWQRQWLAGAVLERQLEYWRQQLAGAPAVLELAGDKPRPSVQSHRGATQLFSVSEPVSTKLRALCRGEGVTLFMGLLAAFNVLLSRYSGQQEILVGTPIANRTRAELEPLIGFFSNTLVLRTSLAGGPSFRELLRRVREVCLGAYAHQDVPFERLVEELSPERDLSRTPLFQVLFSLHGINTNQPEISGLSLKPLRVETGTSKVDLSFYLAETVNEVKGAIEYSTELFSEETIARMSRHFHVLLEGVVAAPDESVAALPLLTFAEEQQVLWEWNETERQYPQERCIQRLFEEQVKRTPAAIALATEEDQLTYAELNERANQVAGYLRELGVGPEVLVAVMLERSVELIVGLLGVLKAGGAYVPLDVQYPAERIAYMLADTKARVLLTQQRLLGQLPAHEARTVCLDSQLGEIVRHGRTNPEPLGNGDNVAYVIYTSGSTGKPKGICVTHKAISRLVLNTNYVQLSASDRIAQVSNSSFDAATFEIWGGLLNGARVEIIRKEIVLDPGELSREFKSRSITTTFLTTALFNRIAAEDPSAFQGVKQVLVGGEEVGPKWVREVLSHGKPERLLNCYGPTESTTFTTWYEIRDAEEGATTVPIGSPISNTTVYILDETLSPVPVGIRGELYIGGDGLARGYLGRPELTAEKFVPHPFSRVPGARLYKTGDVCRYRVDGSIDFQGRADHQVKLRGFRIELGEIEAVAGRYKGVKKALAVLLTDEVSDEKQIVAYLEATQDRSLDTNELRVYLKEKLPEYMVPSSFVLISSWPLTVNGKIDRAALPKPDVQPEPETEEDQLRTGFEEMVTDIWREVLGIDSIGVSDNFFDIGGHSLLATQVVSRVRERFGIQLKIGSIFERPTVAELAEAVATAIRGSDSVQATPIKPVNRKKQKLPLSYAQQRLWFLDQLMPGTALYSVPILYRLNGQLKLEALEKSFTEIIRRHESLRTRIEMSGGTPVQVIEKAGKLKLDVLDFSGLKHDETELQRLIKSEWQEPFDLEHGPFLRIKLFALSDQEHLLLITMHHIISDGWSLEVLTRELSALYEAYSSGQSSLLEELPLQYADYAVWQRQWLAGAVLERQLEYWRQQLAGAPAVLELAGDKPRPSVQSHRGATQLFSVSEQVSTKLRALCRGEGVTLFMGLLAAFNVLLSRYSGQQEILVGTPIANRTRAELEPLIGFFSNTLVLRTSLAGGPSFRELLRRVREVCLGAYAHQDVPFERLVEELSPERDLSRTPLFQVMFSLLHAGAKRIELPGLSMFPSVVDTESSKFDLSLGMFERKQGLKGAFEYNTELFSEETIARMSRHFHVLLEGIVAAPDESVAELPLLTFAEEQQVLWEWNETERQYPQERSIQRLFEEQVKRTPAALALVTEAETLTYAELNERANQVAGYLRELGVGPEVLVAVMLERSVELIVGLLGVLKAGGAYVPLDVQYPAERIAYMLADTKARVLLTQQRLLGQLPAHEARTVCLDSQWGEIVRHGRSDLEPLGTADNLAYVIYTSGSTGKPKGVAIEHRRTVAFLHWALEVFDPQQLAGVLASTSICFDLSIFEIFVPLSQGGTVILSENVLALPSLRAANQVTLINTVPSGIAELVRMKGIPASVRTINLAGEALKDSLVQEIYKQPTIDQVLNLYGPSEDTTYSTYTGVKKGHDEHVTIGRPVANTQAYVLDQRQHPVPLGVAGELYLGGEGLARCYLNRPELTAEKFVPNPFGKQLGTRLYRTGDLVRYLPDGRIEYLGRADHQVKLRGYRIELGEIEALLAADEGVREVVVVIKEGNDGDRRLIAYLVAEQGHTLSENLLREHLKEKLPQYMIPAAFVMMDALPLTPNGKVNRAALPAPAFVQRQLPAALIMPRTEAEAAIAAVWQEVLKLDHAGMDDNFFDLGGHSLLLVQVHFKLQGLFDQSLTVIDLFKYPTISALARFLTGSETETTQPIAAEVEPAKHSSTDRENAIAIIGMAGRLPGASTLDQFWENLKNGVESIKSFSDHELESQDIEPATLKDPNYVKAGAFLDGIDLFDASFFDFNPKEAEITDPQQRLFLECAWEALEQSGYATENSGRVGVFAGAGLSGYLQNLYANPEVMRSTNAFQVVIGNDKDYLATRVSYKLNLKGPSLTVQTACSTSLVAVHTACQSLLNRECEIALAGGISIRVPQKIGYYYQEGGINSPDGHCRAFDASAQGTVPGNGGGVVVLKRLADALADGDNIQAVILGSAINNDGSGKVGYTAPSIDGQAEVIAQAQRAAGIEPQTVTYVEAHGTGTPLGDPIELTALSQAFGPATAKKNYCAIGSLKTNMGHLDTGAGVAGLIKTVLALNHQMIPPSLHFEQPNHGSNLDDSPFYINSTLRDWITDGIPRRAGVSSFGIGGTNAHVVLEEPPQTGARLVSTRPHLLPLSAKTSTALDAMSVNLLDYLKQHDDVDLRDLAYTLQAGRRFFNHRRMLVCEDAADCIAQLSNAKMATAVVESRHRLVVFMYPGQGSQHVRMGWGLYKSSAVFREQVDRCAKLLLPHLGLDLRSLLYPSDEELESSRLQLNQTSISQPALFVVEYALTQLWLEMGLKPEATIGHSLGEYVSACVAGVFSLEDALKLVAERGRLMNAMPRGSMLIVPLPEQEVRKLLNADLSLAAVNGPSLCVVSGPTDAVDELERALIKTGVEGHPLRTSHAFHSKMMEPIVSQFMEAVKGIALSPPKIPYVSNLTGTWITESQATDPIYWGNHLRQTVRFAEGLRELLKDQGAIVLEVGPGKGLSGLARQESERVALSTLGAANSLESDESHFLKTSGSLWLAGVRLNLSKVSGYEQPRRVALPTYPFERKRHWVDRAKRAARKEPLPTVLVELPDVQTPNGATRRDVVQQIVSQQLQISTRQNEIMAQQLALLQSRTVPRINGSHRKSK